MLKSLSVSMQVLFDDIGPSMIRVDRADLQLQLILSFLQFLGLPGPPARFSTTSSSNILLDDLAFLEEVPDPERPLTSHDLPMAGTCAVGHMTCLSGCGDRQGCVKQGGVSPERSTANSPTRLCTGSSYYYSLLAAVWETKGLSKTINRHFLRTERVIFHATTTTKKAIHCGVIFILIIQKNVFMTISLILQLWYKYKINYIIV